MHLTRKEYCARMRSSDMWGGGPELCGEFLLSPGLSCCGLLLIVKKCWPAVLSNFYQRPIHVFRLLVRPAQRRSNPQAAEEFGLECIAAIGSPLFDSKEPFR